MARIVPHLWYTKDAEEAARFYASVIPDSRVDNVASVAVDNPSGPAESVVTVQFTLAGTPFMAIGAGPLDPFNHAVSFIIECDGQAEIDSLWDALAEGGQEEQCGWLRDRWGLCWQIVPRRLGEMMADPDRAKAARVGEAMLGMVRFDLAALERAFEGR